MHDLFNKSQINVDIPQARKLVIVGEITDEWAVRRGFTRRKNAPEVIFALRTLIDPQCMCES